MNNKVIFAVADGRLYVKKPNNLDIKIEIRDYDYDEEMEYPENEMGIDEDGDKYHIV